MDVLTDQEAPSRPGPLATGEAARNGRPARNGRGPFRNRRRARNGRSRRNGQHAMAGNAMGPARVPCRPAGGDGARVRAHAGISERVSSFHFRERAVRLSSMGNPVEEARRDLVGTLRLVHAAWAREVEKGKREMQNTERELSFFAEIGRTLAECEERVAEAEAIANLREVTKQFPRSVADLIALGIARLEHAVCDAAMPKAGPAGPGWSTPLGDPVEKAAAPPDGGAS